MRKLKNIILILTILSLKAIPVSAVTSFELGNTNFTRTDAVDIASHQKWMTSEDFTTLKNSGVKYLIIKASENVDYENPYLAKHKEYAEANGLAVASYHYSKYTDVESARAEARMFVETLKKNGLDENTLIFNDLEDKVTYKDKSEAQVIENTKAFFDQLKELGYNNIGLYTYANFRYRSGVEEILGKEDTWIAQYPDTPSTGGAYEVKWKDSGYGAWQYASSMTLKGHRLDANIDYGMLASRISLEDGTNWDTDANKRTGKTKAEKDAERRKVTEDQIESIKKFQYNEEVRRIEKYLLENVDN